MNIVIYSKKNCSYCTKARQFLKEKNINFTEYKLDEDFTRDQLLNIVPEAKTYPVILIDSKFIGGFVDLKKLIEEKDAI